VTARVGDNIDRRRRKSRNEVHLEAIALQRLTLQAVECSCACLSVSRRRSAALRISSAVASFDLRAMVGYSLFDAPKMPAQAGNASAPP
jgi:hypothetical protein